MATNIKDVLSSPQIVISKNSQKDIIIIPEIIMEIHCFMGLNERQGFAVEIIRSSDVSKFADVMVNLFSFIFSPIIFEEPGTSGIGKLKFFFNNKTRYSDRFAICLKLNNC